ncbi:MAG: hypothetical protein ACJAUV_001013 [Flavobacteriales bacterium]|jgi:hypothetical protein
MNAHKFRVTLDHQKDIYRDLVLLPTHSLTEFHEAITKAFGFSGMEMAAFYESDADWNKGNEIPLFDMMMDLEEDDFNEIPSSMDVYDIEYGLNHEVTHYVYVYDFLKMWCFYVEYVGEEEVEENLELPLITVTFGEAPSEHTEKDLDMSEFTDAAAKPKSAGSDDDEEEDEFGAMFDDLEEYDDNDLGY